MPDSPIPSLLEIDDDGIISVRIGGTIQAIDVYAVWNQIVEIRRTCDDEQTPTHVYHARLVELLGKAGFEGISHYAADEFVTKLAKVVAALGKVSAGEPTPASPASTAPAS